MTHLALDPGLANTGWAIMDLDEVYKVGLITTESRIRSPKYLDLDNRVRKLAAELEQLVVEWDPQMALCEAMGGSKSANAVKHMAMAQACVATLFEIHAIPLCLVNALKVKKTVTGLSMATKSEVQGAVIELYPDVKEQIELAVGKAKARQEHIYDAVAIGYTLLKGME